MSDITHRALLVVNLHSQDTDAARDAVDQAVSFSAAHPDVVSIEASPPALFRGDPIRDGERYDPTVILDPTDAAAAGAVIRAHLKTHDALMGLGMLQRSLPNRNKLEELAERLDGGEELEPIVPEPAQGEVFPFHRGSRAS
jgi:hypothetical protein